MHQLDDLALKSPTATTQKGLFSVTTFKFKFKSSRNESKLSAVWLGNWRREIKLQILEPIWGSNRILSLK